MKFLPWILLIIGVLVFYFLGQPSGIDATVGNELNEVPLEYIGIKHLLAQLIGQICILVSVFMLLSKYEKTNPSQQM